MFGLGIWSADMADNVVVVEIIKEIRNPQVYLACFEKKIVF